MMIKIFVPYCRDRKQAENVANKIRKSIANGIKYEIVIVNHKQYGSLYQNPSFKITPNKQKFNFDDEFIQGCHTTSNDYMIVLGKQAQSHLEILSAMIQGLDSGFDIVIPNRIHPAMKYRNKFNRGFPWFTSLLGRALLKRVRHISDPTHDTFAIRHSVIEHIQLKPIGWSMLLDILTRGNYQTVMEIPFHDTSKASKSSRLPFAEKIKLIRHILFLAMGNSEDRRFFLFAAVGLSGVIINMICYDLMVKLNMNISLAGFIAAFIALCSNFILNDRVTWAEVRDQSLILRATKYFITALCGIGINVGILSFLYYRMHVQYLLANLLGIAVAMGWNYLLSNIWAWKSSNKRSASVTRSRMSIEQSRAEAQ